MTKLLNSRMVSGEKNPANSLFECYSFLNRKIKETFAKTLLHKNKLKLEPESVRLQASYILLDFVDEDGFTCAHVSIKEAQKDSSYLERKYKGKIETCLKKIAPQVFSRAEMFDINLSDFKSEKIHGKQEYKLQPRIHVRLVLKPQIELERASNIFE